ncbi:MAG: hypothetical protein VX833_03725 [Actinomycetota bacterium]|nr:hypothetical protein [Actinomycetota bacterium]
MRGRPEPEQHLGTISGWTGIRSGFSNHHSSVDYSPVDYSSVDYSSVNYDLVDYDLVDYDLVDYGAVDYHGGPPAHRRRRGRGVDLRPHPVQRL